MGLRCGKKFYLSDVENSLIEQAMKFRLMAEKSVKI